MSNTKELKGVTINYLDGWGENEETIKYVRGSKNTKKIKNILGKAIKQTMENTDLDLCGYEKLLIKSYNLVSLNAWYKKEREEEDKLWEKQKKLNW